jgi:hypothetical protein
MSQEKIIPNFDPPAPILATRSKPMSVQRLGILAFWGIAPLWFKPLAWWLALTPNQFLGFLGLVSLTVDIVLIWILLGVFLILVATPVLLCFRKTRGWALRAGLFSVLFLPAWGFGEYLGRIVWRESYVHFIAQGEPLIRAISAYEAAHGRLPSALSELVPEFLPSVPTPRTGGHYIYSAGKDAASYENNPWTLRVSVPCHPMGFDQILYFPRQNYPQNGYGGWIERFGTWGYVHE